MTWLAPFIAERDILADKVMAAGALIISGRLRALNLHYPRHTFKFVQGMGTEFLTVTPQVFCENITDNWSGIKTLRESHGLKYFFEQYDAIMAVSDIVDEEFRLDIGDVE